jgi:DDE superfamily endonuclease
VTAVTVPARVGAQHQSLLHFAGEAAWSDERVFAKVREMVLSAIERPGPIQAWIIDDTGFPKPGAGLGWRGAAMLRPTRQAVQLSGRSVTVDCQSPCERASGLYLPKD